MGEQIEKGATVEHDADISKFFDYLAETPDEANVIDERADAENSDIANEAAAAFIEVFGSGDETPYIAHDWVAHVPTHYCNQRYCGWLYGIIRPETESIYIFDSPIHSDNPSFLIGLFGEAVTTRPEISSDYWIEGRFEQGNPFMTIEVKSSDGVIAHYPIRIKQYDTTVKLFSRNTGLLESDVMLDKCAVIVGVGSVGSLVALELAKSGVGSFVLIDTDTFELHNICRHQCGFSDLGRYKVDAVRDKILDINPYAKVEVLNEVIQRIPKDQIISYLGRDSIVIGCGDNRASADYACKLACETDSSFVATCCWSRAFAGEVFYWQSGHGLSCYECALGGLLDDERPESHQHYFASDKDEDELAFEPGIAADIDFVTLIAIKVCIDLLNRDNPNFTPKVINYLKQYTWISNTNSPKIGGEFANIFSHPLQITTCLSVEQRPDCINCAQGA